MEENMGGVGLFQVTQSDKISQWYKDDSKVSERDRRGRQRSEMS
jgi:hypothetical protein